MGKLGMTELLRRDLHGRSKGENKEVSHRKNQREEKERWDVVRT